MGHTPRRPTHSFSDPRELGIEKELDIPGGLEHIGNAETHTTKVAVPARRHIPAMNEHGVAGDDPDKPYEQPRAGKVNAPKTVALPHPDHAVPVYMVQTPGDARKHRKTFATNILIPANTADPIQICGRDYGRVEVQLSNQDTANDIRFSEERSELLEGRGSKLTHAMSSYVTIKTQDELYGLSTSGTAVYIEVLLTTEVNS